MTELKEYDYAIIGSGILGSVCYKFLKQSGKTVKVIDLTDLPNLSNSKNNIFDFKEGTVFYGTGGTSKVWSSTYDLYPKNIFPKEIEDKLQVENIVKFCNFLEYFRIPLRELLNQNKINNKFYSFENNFEVNLTIRNNKNFKFESVFEIDDLKKLSIDNFILDTNSKTITNSSTGSSEKYKKIIFAAGGLGNSYLINLLFSKYENANGKNYTNHLKFVPIIFETKNYHRISKILNQRKKNNYLMFPSYLLRDKKNGLIHSFRIYNSSIKQMKSGVHYRTLLFERILRKFGFSKYFKVLIYSDMKQSVNFLEFGENSISLNSRNDRTIEDLEKTIEELKLQISKNKYIKTVLLKDDFEISEGSHHIGSTTMGSNNQNSVVDLNLNLHHNDGFKIVGTSVLPCPGSGHPTLTAILLAILSLENDMND